MEQDLTVLVLGAGVSIDSGDKANPKRGSYPSGEELVNELISISNSSSIPLKTLVPEALGKALTAGRPLSIDAFLASNKQFRDHCAVAIQEILLKKEVEEIVSLNPFYRNLFKHLTPQTFSKVKIVTFNYDRVLDAYLDRLLGVHYGMTHQRHQDKLKELEIRHVYGRCFPLNTRDNKGLPYGEIDSDLGRYNFQSRHNWAKSNFSFVFDEHSKKDNDNTADEALSQERMDILDWLDNANQVFFLGFGYDTRNLDFLNTRQALMSASGKPKKLLAGTSYGLGKVTQKMLRSRYTRGIHFFPLKAERFFEDGLSLFDYKLNIEILRENAHVR